jgi:hypothetical protein
MNMDAAKRAIEENLQQYLSATTDPAMFNLNLGLLGVIEGIEEIADRLEVIEREVKNP